MPCTLPPHVSDISIGMLNERRKDHELRRLILIGSLLAHSVRVCAYDTVRCDADRSALADEWDKQLEIARPHLLRAEAPEKKR